MNFPSKLRAAIVLAPLLLLTPNAVAAQIETQENQWTKRPRPIPDARVVDQDGKPWHFYSDLIKGKTVAINFIFTSCGAICPSLTAIFKEAHALVPQRSQKPAHFISVSVDPLNDTPAVLKAFAADAGANWTFVTGDRQEIDRVLKAFGTSLGVREDHSPLIVVGNDEIDQWTKLYGLVPPRKLTAAVLTAQRDPRKPSSMSRRPSSSFVHYAPAVGLIRTKENVTDLARDAASYFSNLPLLNHENRPVRFYRDLVKGRVVLVNFMFTTCANVCSPMTTNLVRTQRLLNERAPGKVKMISITVDPETDTPAVLNQFAIKHGVAPGWDFLTGKKENVDWVLYKLGGFVEDKLTHSTVLLVGNDATGEWIKTTAMAKPDEIAGIVERLTKP